MKEIESFFNKISSFDIAKVSDQIDYFSYFILIIKKQDGITSKDIKKCFEELHLNPYSNIPNYLSSKSKGKEKKFIKK